MTLTPCPPLPDLCDAHPDAVTVLEPVFCNFGGRSAFCGPASTVACFEDNSLVADAVAEPGAGRVLVVDGGGSLRCGLFGDNLAAKASANGWAGVLVHGCIRDVDEIGDTDIGVQALGLHPRKSIKRGVGHRDVEVQLPGAGIAPGQWVYADNNGVLVAAAQLTL